MCVCVCLWVCCMYPAMLMLSISIMVIYNPRLSEKASNEGPVFPFWLAPHIRALPCHPSSWDFFWPPDSWSSARSTSQSHPWIRWWTCRGTWCRTNLQIFPETWPNKEQPKNPFSSWSWEFVKAQWDTVRECDTAWPFHKLCEFPHVGARSWPRSTSSLPGAGSTGLPNTSEAAKLFTEAPFASPACSPIISQLWSQWPIFAKDITHKPDFPDIPGPRRSKFHGRVQPWVIQWTEPYWNRASKLKPSGPAPIRSMLR